LLIHKWMLENDDQLWSRVKSLSDDLAKEASDARRAELSDEKARVEAYRQAKKRLRDDQELRDLRLVNRELQIMNEWLLSKVEGLWFILSEDKWSARFEGETIGGGKPTGGIRAIAFLLQNKRPQGGASDVRAAMDRTTTVVNARLAEGRAQHNELPITTTAERALRDKDGNLSVATSAERAAMDDEDRKEEVLRLRDELAKTEKRMVQIDAEAENRAALHDDEGMDRLEVLSKELERDRASLAERIERLTYKGIPKKTKLDEKAVGQRIREDLKKIRRQSPNLASHLEKAIKDREGANIRYEPDDDDGDTWEWEVWGV
jgi:hypothetical protein